MLVRIVTLLGCSGTLLLGQFCRLSVAGLNQSRRAMGPVHAECPGDLVHTAPFGNWGVSSNYGKKGDSHQFDGWCHETRVCNNIGICSTDCTDGWYEWNSCTDDPLYQAPNCTLYNAANCTEQATTTGVNVHGTKYVDFLVRCPSSSQPGGPANQGGCADINSYNTGVNFMSLYELDPVCCDDLVQTMYFPPAVISLNCDVWGCSPAASPWMTPSSYDSPTSPPKVYAEFAALVNWGAFVDPFRVCAVSSATVTYVSAASYIGPSLAPDSIASGFGTELAPVTLSAQIVPLPETMAGATLVVRDSAHIERKAPLFYVSPTQVNFLVPAGTAAGPATISVFRGDVAVLSGAAQMEPLAPALFSANADGKGVASAFVVRVAADGSQTTQPVFQCGAAAGSCTFEPVELGLPTDRTFLALFGTGIRNNAGVSSVSVDVGGVHARTVYAGPQQQFVGLDQVNVELPVELRGRGQVEISMLVGGHQANLVSVFIR